MKRIFVAMLLFSCVALIASAKKTDTSKLLTKGTV